MAAIKQGTPLGSALPPPERPPESWERGYYLLRKANVELLGGRSNAIGIVTIISGDSPLTVLDERCTAQSVVLLMLETAELANGFVWWVSNVSNGSFVLEFTFGGQLPTIAFRYLIQG